MLISLEYRKIFFNLNICTNVRNSLLLFVTLFHYLLLNTHWQMELSKYSIFLFKCCTIISNNNKQTHKRCDINHLKRPINTLKHTRLAECEELTLIELHASTIFCSQSVSRAIRKANKQH